MNAREFLIAAASVAALAGCPSGGGGGTGPLPELPGTGVGNTGTPAQVVPGKLEDLKGNVVDIAIVGLDADRTDKAKHALTSAVGQPFSLDTVGADLTALWHQGDVTDVTVDGREVGNGVGLRYTVKLQPTIAAIDVKGTTAMAASELIENMPFKRGSPVDPAQLADVRNALVDQYKSLGYAKVEVTWAATHHDLGDDVVFTVVEGAPIAIKTIDLTGVKAMKRAEVIKALGQDGGPAVGGKYWDLALERGLLYIAAFYYDHGYLQVAIDPPDIKPSADGGQVGIAIAIKEGAQYKLGKIDFQGDVVAELGDHGKLLGMKSGEVFNRSKAATGMDKIRQAYTTAGYADVYVNPETKIDDKKHKLDLTIVVGHAPKK